MSSKTTSIVFDADTYEIYQNQPKKFNFSKFIRDALVKLSIKQQKCTTPQELLAKPQMFCLVCGEIITPRKIPEIAGLTNAVYCHCKACGWTYSVIIEKYKGE
jgi:hypothetical protein